MKLPPFSLTYTVRDKRRKFQKRKSFNYPESFLYCLWSKSLVFSDNYDPESTFFIQAHMLDSQACIMILFTFLIERIFIVVWSVNQTSGHKNDDDGFLSSLPRDHTGKFTSFDRELLPIGSWIQSTILHNTYVISLAHFKQHLFSPFEQESWLPENSIFTPFNPTAE